MATQSNPSDIDPKEYERAQNMWHAFTTYSKYSIIGIAALLILLALVFI